MKYSKDALKRFAEFTGKSTEFWESQFADLDDSFGLVVPGDNDYPYSVDKNGFAIELGFTTKRDEFGTKVPNRKGAPHYLFYRGDISLLNKQNFVNNVAVIGLLNPTSEIVERERIFVSELVKRGANIVSGLALGCDTVAHRACLENGGKTIAILPSRLDNIMPKENAELANEIVLNGGLLITEYYNEPIERFEASARYIERDRLQAYYSNSIILTASYRHPEKRDAAYPQDGIKRDSGSRHAMKIAGECGRRRYVMYNKELDAGDEMFDLNRDLLFDKKNPAKVLTSSAIDEVMNGKEPGVLPIFGL